MYLNSEHVIKGPKWPINVTQKTFQNSLQDKHDIFQSKEKDYQNRIKVFEKSKINCDKIIQVQNETIHKLKTSKSENEDLQLKLGQLKATCNTNKAKVARLETEKNDIEKVFFPVFFRFWDRHGSQ